MRRLSGCGRRSTACALRSAAPTRCVGLRVEREKPCEASGTCGNAATFTQRNKGVDTQKQENGGHSGDSGGTGERSFTVPGGACHAGVGPSHAQLYGYLLRKKVSSKRWNGSLGTRRLVLPTPHGDPPPNRTCRPCHTQLRLLPRFQVRARCVTMALLRFSTSGRPPYPCAHLSKHQFLSAAARGASHCACVPRRTARTRRRWGSCRPSCNRPWRSTSELPARHPQRPAA